MLRELENMTWLEAEQAAKETDTILIPIGAVEPQGSHLPLGTDTIAAKYAALKVGEKANVVVAPAIPIGYSAWFKGFPGLMSLRKETLTEVLRQYCRSLAASGFTRQIFFSPHFGNNDVIAEVGVELRNEGVRVAMINLWHVTNQIIKNKNLEFKEAHFTHAGEVMTSIMMAIAPEMVKMETAVAEYPDSKVPNGKWAGLFDVNYKGINYSVYHFSGEDSKSNAYGDPMAATPEKGRMLIDGWVESIMDFIEDFKTYNI